MHILRDLASLADWIGRLSLMLLAYVAGIYMGIGALITLTDITLPEASN